MDGLVITKLPRNPYSLGLLVRYLAGKQPFARFDFGQTVGTLIFQLHQGTHLAATRNDALVGYLGWQRVDTEVAKAWAAGQEGLIARPDGQAVAVTVFVTDAARDILPMIRAAKRAEPGRSVYWRRYFSDGRDPQRRAVEVAARG